MPISLIVVVLLAIVVISYRQTLYAYPSGGGSYIVSRENLGPHPGAGGRRRRSSSTTSSPSPCRVSAGTAAITSAFPSLRGYRVEICVGFVILMTVANLRGVKESGRIFAGPTYIYVGALLAAHRQRALPGVLLRTSDRSRVRRRRSTSWPSPAPPSAGITLFILMRAFSSGAVALSGVEAVSNGVPAFRRPEPRNASMTLIAMGTILGGCFFGLSVLAHHLQPIPQENGETVLSIMGTAVFGDGTFLYYLLQFSTFAILILAANTAYADFPRLSSIISRDGYLPRQLSNRGDRLVFSNGVLVLAGLATVLIVVFKGDVSALIPLYAVGVFTGFTLSQTGMVVHHWRLRERGWQLGRDHQRRRRRRHRRRAHRRGGVEVRHRRVDPGRPHPGASSSA